MNSPETLQLVVVTVLRDQNRRLSVNPKLDGLFGHGLFNICLVNGFLVNALLHPLKSMWNIQGSSVHLQAFQVHHIRICSCIWCVWKLVAIYNPTTGFRTTTAAGNVEIVKLLPERCVWASGCLWCILVPYSVAD